MCKYIDILKREVVPAEGCTEPIAVAYAVSLASEQIKGEIKQIQLYLSANIIKNALGVGIPGTGKIGIEIAAALGGIIKKSEKKLEILSNFTKDELEKANEIVNNKVVKISQKYTEEKLYIEAIVRSDNGYAKVVISREHTNIILIEKNDNVLYKSKVETEENIIDEKTMMEALYPQDVPSVKTVSEEKYGFNKNTTESSAIKADSEKEKIICALKQANGRKSKAAEILGVDRSTLWRKMKNYDLK